VLLGSPFLAALQVLLYTGAILVLFLFVIMLLNLREGGGFGQASGRRNLLKLLGVGGSVAALAVLAVRVSRVFRVAEAPESLAPGFGGYRELGIALYTEYVVPVELTGLILLAAIVGAVILAQRRAE